MSLSLSLSLSLSMSMSLSLSLYCLCIYMFPSLTVSMSLSASSSVPLSLSICYNFILLEQMFTGLENCKQTNGAEQFVGRKRPSVFRFGPEVMLISPGFRIKPVLFLTVLSSLLTFALIFSKTVVRPSRRLEWWHYSVLTNKINSIWASVSIFGTNLGI